MTTDNNRNRKQRRRERVTYMQIFLDLEKRVNSDTDSGVSERRLARKARRAAVVSDYKSGMSVADIADRYKVTRPTVYNDLAKSGIILRTAR